MPAVSARSVPPLPPPRPAPASRSRPHLHHPTPPHPDPTCARLERQLSSKAAALPPEPPANDPGTVRVAVRLPGGGRHSRLFRTTDALRVS